MRTLIAVAVDSFDEEGNPMIDNEHPEVRYGETVETEERSRFYVEAIWPCTCEVKHKRPCGMWKHDPFRRYAASTFNDKRDPGKRQFFGSTVGDFDAKNPDVAGHPSRVHGPSPDKSVSFTDPVAALAYANRLAAFGELASKYDAEMGRLNNRKDDARYSRPIKTRVVHERSAKVVKVVKAVVAGEIAA